MLCCGVFRPADAGTILKQFGAFKAVSAIIPQGNSLWLATSGGVVRYDRPTGATKIFREITDVPDLNVTAGVIDSSQDLWFGTASGFLIRSHPQTETFTPNNALASVGWQIACMVRSGGFIFIGTQKGLCVFNIIRQSFQNVTQFGSSTTTNVSEIRVFGDTIAAMIPDGIAYAVVPDLQNAIFSDPQLWTVEQVSFPPALNPVGIVRNGDSLIASPRLSVRIGTNLWQFGGMDTLPGDQLFGANNAVFLNGAFVDTVGSTATCLASLGDSQVAIGTRSTFWYLCNVAKKAFVRKTINGPEDSYIMGCAVDKNGVMWYVPYDMSNGVGKFDGTQWTSWNDTLGLPPFTPGPFISKSGVMVTSLNDIWVSTFTYGAQWLNRQTGLWSSYRDRNSYPIDTLPSPIARFGADSSRYWWTFVSSVAEDSLGYIWLANNSAYNGNILHVRKPRDNSAWRSFNISLFQDQDFPLVTGPLATNQSRTLGMQYIYIGFNRKADQSGGGMAIVSYPSSQANPVDTLTQIQFQVYTQPVSVTGFAVVNDTLVWLSAEDGIYKLTNNNVSTLTRIGAVSSSGLFEAIALGPNGKPVFCKDKDLYSYNDDDSSVTNLTKYGSLGTPVNWITFDKRSAAFWIGATAGLYRFQSGDTGAVQAGANPGSIDVYPNPVSRVSLKNMHPLRFARLNAQGPHVRIYEASGTLVRVMTDQNTTIINWNGTNLAGQVVLPGTYFYEANSANGKSCRGKIFVIP